MNVNEYNYKLPESVIALYPPKVRGDTKLLVLDKKTGELKDDMYKNLHEYIKPNDLVILNDTKVLPARLIAETENGSNRELLLLEKHGKSNNHHSSLVMYRRKVREDQMLTVGDVQIIVKEVYENGTAQIHSSTDLWELAEDKGTVPLPPYMHRNEESGDRERYQTVFAKERGSVAAPTASLNMTEKLIEKLKQKGVAVETVTLHVGLGTFMPIRVDDISKHKMHQEYFEIPKQTVAAIRKVKEQGGKVIAVGTTVIRTLEYAANEILKSDKGELSGEADIFIYPGYKFKIVDSMVTNFHAPKSTVLMMSSAFAGWDNLKRSYEYALENQYNFLSYGDSMLIK